MRSSKITGWTLRRRRLPPNRLDRESASANHSLSAKAVRRSHARPSMRSGSTTGRGSWPRRSTTGALLPRPAPSAPRPPPSALRPPPSALLPPPCSQAALCKAPFPRRRRDLNRAPRLCATHAQWHTRTAKKLRSEGVPDERVPSRARLCLLPGLRNPKGRCVAWARCNDGGLPPPTICGCDGIERTSRNFPFPKDAREVNQENALCPRVARLLRRCRRTPTRCLAPGRGARSRGRARRRRQTGSGPKCRRSGERNPAR